jgi:hypothetical protein
MKDKTILAIDPGNEQSGYVLINGMTILEKGKRDNSDIIKMVPCGICEIVVLEMIASYGMPVGQTTFDTCVWIGRFKQAAKAVGHKVEYVYRKKPQKEKGIESECMYLCKNTRAKDPHIRQAIIDMFPADGGGKIPQVGTKKQPGKLYGVSGDVWSALAVALTYQGSNQYQKECTE